VRAGWIGGAGEPAPLPPVRLRYRWRTTADGGMETDADALVERCLRAIDGAVRAGRGAGIRPAAVALAAFWHGVAGIGPGGRAVTPLSGWGDTRARAVAERLRARLDPEAAHRRTGCYVDPLHPAVRIPWLRARHGDTLPHDTAWGSVGELLLLRVAGVLRSSLSMASATGLLELRRGGWDAEVLEACGIAPGELPGVDDAPALRLLPEHAARWPELDGIPWYPALGDGACASLGTGAVEGRYALTVGTTAAVRVLRRDPRARVPEGLWCYRLDAERTVAGRAISNGGSGFAWLRRTLRLPPAAELEARLGAIPPGGNGLRVVPRLRGERPPGGAPAGAAVAGITAATGAVEIAHAWLEATAAEIAAAVRAVEEACGPAAEVVAGGGALEASPAFAEMVARAVGRPFRRPPHAEGTLRGAALVALERLGAAAVLR
jgi:gluconokinase